MTSMIHEGVGTYTCPHCRRDASTNVKDSRPRRYKNVQIIRRRRHCRACGKRFTTYEVPTELLNDYSQEMRVLEGLIMMLQKRYRRASSRNNEYFVDKDLT